MVGASGRNAFRDPEPEWLIESNGAPDVLVRPVIGRLWAVKIKDSSLPEDSSQTAALKDCGWQAR